MTKIYAERYKENFYLEVEGHSGYAEQGKDIVCAGVSVLCYTLERWCLEHQKDIYNHTIKIKDGYFQIAFSGYKEAETVYECIVGGLKLIAKEYPEHIKIESEYVRGEK